MNVRDYKMRAADQRDVTGAELVRLARSSIEHGLLHGEPIPVDCSELPRALMSPGATFTTLRLENDLRGCCGSLEARRPLAMDVARSAFQAAFRDPRFDPVGRDEVAAIRLEVSVLSPLESIPVTDEADLLSRVKPGTDGLVIVDGARRATFLPEVWESCPDPQQFLARLKVKCGLPEDYWSEQLRFLSYRTTSYTESVRPGPGSA